MFVKSVCAPLLPDVYVLYVETNHLLLFIHASFVPLKDPHFSSYSISTQCYDIWSEGYGIISVDTTAFIT